MNEDVMSGSDWLMKERKEGRVDEDVNDRVCGWLMGERMEGWMKM